MSLIFASNLQQERSAVQTRAHVHKTRDNLSMKCHALASAL